MRDLKLNDIKIGMKFDFLTVIEKPKDIDNIMCQCVCGRKLYISLAYLRNEQSKKSCGCGISKYDLPNLYRLWKDMNNDEKSNWEDWIDFVLWSKKLGYIEVYSYKKINKKLPYNKDNIEFGLYINKEFFSVQRLKENRIVFDLEYYEFVTSVRIKDLIVNDTKITRSLTRQSSKHKKLPDNLFKYLK